MPRHGEWVELLFFHIRETCMFKSVRHLVTQEYFYNKQLCKSACLNMYMKFSANGSPGGRASNVGNFVSTPNPPHTQSKLHFWVFRDSNHTYTPIGTSTKIRMSLLSLVRPVSGECLGWRWGRGVIYHFLAQMCIHSVSPKIL